MGDGLFFNISSILSRISGVSLGMTSNAFKFSTTCSGLEAPRITVLVFGFRAIQANARKYPFLQSVRTCLGQLGELLNLPDLFQTFLSIEALDGFFEDI